MAAYNRRIIWICSAFGLATGVGFWWLGEAAIVPALTALLAITLAILRDEAHRLDRRISESFRQTEAAVSLYAVVKPRLPLPATRGWAMAPDMAGLVYATVIERRPRRVLELGSGVSTLVAASPRAAVAEVVVRVEVGEPSDAEVARRSPGGDSLHARRFLPSRR